MSLIRSIADSTITVIGKGIAKRMLHSIGDVTHFSYDSIRREVVIEMTLAGEEDPTTIVLADYSVREQNGTVQLKFGRISTSKLWLNAAAQKFFQDRYMDVPEQFNVEVRAIFGEHKSH